MHFSSTLLTTSLLLLSPITHAEAIPAPKPEPVPAALGTTLGPAGPQSLKRQTTLCDDPNYPINCANGYCCPYNTFCDGTTCDAVTVNNGALHGKGSLAAQELALVLGVVGGVFAVL